MKINAMFGEIDAKFSVANYAYDGSIAIELNYYNAEEECYLPYTSVTVCIPGSLVLPNEVCIDTNNLDEHIVKELESQGIISKPRRYVYSGFCKYPVVNVCLDKINKNDLI